MAYSSIPEIKDFHKRISEKSEALISKVCFRVVNDLFYRRRHEITWPRVIMMKLFKHCCSGIPVEGRPVGSDL